MTQVEDLKSFCTELEESGVERVVVRWIDENRPVHDGDEVAIRSVTEATLKAGIDGEIVRRTFEEIPYEKLRSILSPYDFEILYRSDNLT